MQRLTPWILVVVASTAFGVAGSAWAADDRGENHFATIRVDGKKIGQVHYTVIYDEGGQIEQLKTRASLSIFGIDLYSFSQDLDERWRSDELQVMSGRTDDNGHEYRVSLERKPEEFAAERNGDPLTLPHRAFPNSVWHYRITEQSLLINLKDLRLMKVEVGKSQESVEIDGKTFDAERFDFTGDWKASLWFDRNRRLLKLEYRIKEFDVLVTLDQD